VNTIGFIGSGNMAEALIKGIIAAKVYDPDSIFISDVLPDRIDHLVSRYGVQRAQDNAALASTADVIVLSVKPQMLESVLGEIKDTIGTRSLVITIAAGKKIESVTSILGDIPVIRVMPNTPALVLAGASALYPNSRAKDYLDKAMAIFSAVGISAGGGFLYCFLYFPYCFLYKYLDIFGVLCYTDVDQGKRGSKHGPQFI
jgi:pyrroline-5-carboxylate reductase